MTKQEYIDALRRRLENYPEDFRQDIMEAFELHFVEGKSQGKTEEEIMNELGTVDEVMENIYAMEGRQRPLSDYGKAIHQKDEEKKEQEKKEAREASEQLADDLAGFAESLGKSMSVMAKSIARSVSDAFGQIDFKKMEDSLYGEEVTGTIEGCRKIMIDSSHCGVSVDLTPGEELHWSFRPGKDLFTSESPALSAGSSGDSAVFSIKPGNSSGNGKLWIQVPSQIEIINFSLSSGNFSARDLTLEEVGGKCTSGDITLDHVNASKGYFECASGSAVFRRCEIPSLQARTSSGDIRASDLSGLLTASTVSGTIDARSLKGGGVLSSTSGDIRVESSRGSLLQAKTLSGDIEAYGDYKEFVLTASSGDIDAGAEESLESAIVQTSAGDIDFDRSRLGENFAADLSTITGDLDNDTDLETLQETSRSLSAGTGSARIYLKTVTGDITLE